MLEEKIKTLANLRVALEDAKRKKDWAQREFDESPVVTTYQLARGTVDLLESEIRQEALGLYGETGEKKPHQAVEIKIKTEIIIDPVPALEYAKKELPQALTLDTKVFSKVMKSLPLENRPACVGNSEKPTAYISKDLSQYLKEE